MVVSSGLVATGSASSELPVESATPTTLPGRFRSSPLCRISSSVFVVGELTIETGLSVGPVFGSGVLFCSPFSPDGVDGSDAAEQLGAALGFLVGENEFKTLCVMLVFFGDGVAASISAPPEVSSEACICGFFRAKLSDRAAFAHDDRGVAISATHRWRARFVEAWTARQFSTVKNS